MEEKRPSVVIAQKIAAMTGEDPGKMEPLYETVDTDALDSLLQTSNTHGLRVEFDYNGHRVLVEGPEQIDIRSEAPTSGTTVKARSD